VSVVGKFDGTTKVFVLDLSCMPPMDPSKSDGSVISMNCTVPEAFENTSSNFQRWKEAWEVKLAVESTANAARANRMGNFIGVFLRWLCIYMEGARTKRISQASMCDREMIGGY